MTDNYQAAGDGEKKVLPPLNDDQVEYAHELLEELHPLEKTDVRAAFPWLGAVTCYKPKEEFGSSVVGSENDMESQLIGGQKKGEVMINGKAIKKKKPKKKKNNLGDDVTRANPIAKLGFGIVAYVDLLWVLIWTFTLYTIMLLPTMMFFAEGTAYGDVKVKSDYLDTYLGNLGYSSVQCAAIPTAVQTLALSCPYGTFGEVLAYGVNPESDQRNTCVTNDDNRMCQPRSQVGDAINSGFVGKESGSYTFTKEGLYPGDVATQNACFTDNSNLFVQFTCVQAEEDQALKYE